MVGLILLVVASKHALHRQFENRCVSPPADRRVWYLQNSVEMIRSHRQMRSGSLRIGFSLSLHAGLHRRQEPQHQRR